MVTLSRRQTTRSALLVALAMLTVKPAFAQEDQSADDALKIMSADPRFSDWIQILQFSGLTRYAQSAEKFTAFIPTNAAFDKYPDILPELLRGRSRPFPDTDRAVEFVRSHVILDVHPLAEFSGKTATVTSMSGNPIMIDGSKAGVYSVTWTSVHGSTATADVVGPPIVASNAIIYPIDTVVLSSK